MSYVTKWTYEKEQLLVSWAEKAFGYSWMHSQSVTLNKKYNVYISVPASIFGYLAGTATLLMDDPCEGGYSWVKGFIGVSGILAGILSNFQQMFTFKELSEQHRISSLRFLAFFRDITSELSLEPKYRTNPIDYITMKRMEMDIMLEQSPSINEKIVQQFNEKTKKFGSAIHKPEICNMIQTIIPYNSHKKILKNRAKRAQQVTDIDYTLMERSFNMWKGYAMLSKVRKSKLHNNSNVDNNDIQLEVANSYMGGSEMKSHVSENGEHDLDDTSSSEPGQTHIERTQEIIKQTQKQPILSSYENIKIEQNSVISK